MKKFVVLAASLSSLVLFAHAHADDGSVRRCLAATGKFASDTIDLITAGRDPEELANHIRFGRENRHLTRELREAQVAYIYAVASQAKGARDPRAVADALAAGDEERFPLLDRIINECIRMQYQKKRV
ncbi:MAG TPA: hypothetical protein VF203_11670 [Burkholderiales bacterium]